MITDPMSVAPRVDQVPKKSLSEFDNEARNNYNRHEEHGWDGKFGPGSPRYGGEFNNKQYKLPVVDGNGNPITYKEFDVYNVVSRDANRFIAGSDGNVYFTNDHYKVFSLIVE